MISNWQTKKLGEVCKTTSGGTPSRRNPDFYNGSIPWVKSGELDKGIILDTEEKITEEAIKNSSAKVFPKGTLLIALYGATIGKLAFLGVEAATNQAVCGIYESQNIVSKYLYYFLLFNKPKLVQQGVGGAQPNISQTILKDLDLPVPPLETQHTIVSKIEELFSELDQGIADLKTAQEQLKVYQQSVLKHAFEGKLTNKNVKEGELPERWEILKIKDVCEIKGGKNQSKVINPNGKYPIYGSSGIFGYADEYICDENTTIIGRKGNINSPLYVTTKFWNVDTAFGLCVNEKYNSKLLFYFCKGFNFNKLDKSTTIPSLAKSDILSIDIQTPPIEEQHLIVQEIESRLSVADKMKESIQESLQKAEALRQSILKNAFSGELI